MRHLDKHLLRMVLLWQAVVHVLSSELHEKIVFVTILLLLPYLLLRVLRL